MLRERMVAYVASFVGLPYRWGGDDPIQGFDCSGLAQEALASVGIDPLGDQTAQGLYEAFKGRSVPASGFPIAAGCLCFYGKSVKAITHVAISIGENLMIEAGGGGSKTLTAADAAQQNAYVRMRPIHRRGDLVAVVDPFA